SGLTLIFGMMGVLNFAHASFYMLGAYFAFTLGLHVGFWPALVIAPVLVGLLGALVERQGLRRVHGFGHIAELIFTFGVAILIEEVVQLVWGRPAKSYQVPALLDFPLFRVMSSSFPAYKAFMLGGGRRHLRLHLRDPHAHARRPHLPGLAHASGHGRVVRPQRAA